MQKIQAFFKYGDEDSMEYEYDPQMEQALAFRLLHGLCGKYRLWKGCRTMAVGNVFDEDVEINGSKETDNYTY
ncbi:MAG: hypothetical protein K9K81_09620 [Desulfobacteraceae bacterium]|nr:hypothetical protein [Desulfobacteraceae bacterium]